jgi:hypothetical protein
MVELTCTDSAHPRGLRRVSVFTYVDSTFIAAFDAALAGAVLDRRLLHEPGDEVQAIAGDLLPVGVDRQGVATLRDLGKLGDEVLVLLPRCVGGPGDGVRGLAA